MEPTRAAPGATPLNVGEEREAVVRARPEWNATGVLLEPGGRYEMEAKGWWVDFFIPHGPEGDPSPFAYMRRREGKRRMPAENWFALIGAVDRDLDTAFRIGARTPEPVTGRSGELTCFANDMPCWYWNNWGSVTLTVRRIG